MSNVPLGAAVTPREDGFVVGLFIGLEKCSELR
jgi:hypothetical protein